MFWILYRSLTVGETVLFESDDRGISEILLRSVTEVRTCQLIDFCGDLDGALDETLYGVTLTDTQIAA